MNKLSLEEQISNVKQHLQNLYPDKYVFVSMSCFVRHWLKVEFSYNIYEDYYHNATLKFKNKVKTCNLSYEEIMKHKKYALRDEVQNKTMRVAQALREVLEELIDERNKK